MSITYAYLETTNYCNLACSFCNREDVVQGKPIHMSLDNWKLMLDKLKHHPIKEAKLMGMGEPFLHPQFDEVCKAFKQTFPDAKVIVATNCQYKINDTFKRALEYIDELYFSIDGLEENYERDRVGATWPKLISFLEDFKAIDDRKGCSAVINYVVNTLNIFDIPAVHNLIHTYRLDEFRLNIAQVWSEGVTMDETHGTSGYTEYQLDYLKTYHAKYIKGKSDWDFNDCFWVKNGLYVTAGGDVKVCCMNTDATPIGNIFQDDIDVIRETKEFKDIRHGCAINEPTDHCKNCSYKELVPILSRLGVNN